MRRCVLLLLLSVAALPGWAADPDVFPGLDIHDAAAVREASRVLEEEVKLAARPRTYVLIDLVTRVVDIKSRGVALHRMPIERWSATGIPAMAGSFRLLARPPVTRRRVDPGAQPAPISLADMPVRYEVLCDPSFTVEIHPPATDHPLLWLLASSRRWWRQLKDWGRTWFTGLEPSPPFLQLALSAEHAQSLAWSLVDGMPVVIRRPLP